ncbi:MAG: lysylphosphatidylglycerol synthase transmembrane domain-containing protein [Candidatus Brocadiia bacterium]
MKRRVRKTLVLVAKLAVAAGLIALLVRSGQLQPAEIWAAMRRSPLWLGLALLIYNVCIVLTANRWHMLLRAQGLRPSRGACVQMTYTGCFFSCFLPGGTGGDLVKAYYVARDSHKRAEAVTTVFLDRVFGLYCMIGLAAAAVLLRLGHLWHYGEGEEAGTALLGLTQAQLLVVGVLAVFAGATVGLVAFLSPHCRRLVHGLLARLPEPLGSVLKRIYEAVYLYRGQWRVLGKFALYSVSAHVLVSVSLWLVGLSLEDPVAWGGARALNYLFLVPMGLILNGLPIAPAGMGVFEWALRFLFATVLSAGEPNVGANVAFLAHILIIVTNQVGLAFYLKGKRRVEAAMEAAARDAASVPPEPAADADA